MAEVILELPNLGDEAGARATVTYWHKAVGETVEKDADIVEVTYDKAAFYVPSPVSGRLKEILAPEDTTVPLGAPLAVIETSETPEDT